MRRRRSARDRGPRAAPCFELTILAAEVRRRSVVPSPEPNSVPLHGQPFEPIRIPSPKSSEKKRRAPCPRLVSVTPLFNSGAVSMRLTRVLCALVLMCGLLAAAHAESATLTVNAGGDLQAAINAARPGDTILVQGGATFTGNFSLPAKNGISYITIRSSAADGALPAAR